MIDARRHATRRCVGTDFVEALGPTLVVVPHPDDETIGCGGLIALLAERGSPVFVALVSDGTGSHPGSARFPAPARAELRLGELCAALAALGVDIAGGLYQLGCVDGCVPGIADTGFDAAVAALRDALRRSGAATLLVPWRRDPHPDHRAANAIASRANARRARPARVLEYIVWAPERASPSELPQPGEVDEWCIDIGCTVSRKLAALAAHRSQLGEAIDDDPKGFVLSQAMRDRCALPYELYYECRDDGGRR